MLNTIDNLLVYLRRHSQRNAVCIELILVLLSVFVEVSLLRIFSVLPMPLESILINYLSKIEKIKYLKYQSRTMVMFYNIYNEELFIC